MMQGNRAIIDNVSRNSWQKEVALRFLFEVTLNFPATGIADTVKESIQKNSRSLNNSVLIQFYELSPFLYLEKVDN